MDQLTVASIQADIRRGRYTLAPRAMIELDSYLREQYEDEVRTCRRCQKLAMTVSLSVNVTKLTPGCDLRES